MASTTKTLILDLASELSTLTDPQFNMIIDFVNLVITKNDYGLKQQMAQTFLAAHLLTEVATSGSGSGAVTEEKVGDIMKKYDVASSTSGSLLDRTKYGRMFKSIRVVRFT